MLKWNGDQGFECVYYEINCGIYFPLCESPPLDNLNSLFLTWKNVERAPSTQKLINNTHPPFGKNNVWLSSKEALLRDSRNTVHFRQERNVSAPCEFILIDSTPKKRNNDFVRANRRSSHIAFGLNLSQSPTYRDDQKLSLQERHCMGCTGGQRQPGGGIHAISLRYICTPKYMPNSLDTYLVSVMLVISYLIEFRILYLLKFAIIFFDMFWFPYGSEIPQNLESGNVWNVFDDCPFRQLFKQTINE